MIGVIKNIVDYRELIATLAWKNITVRYKQAYLGIVWSVLKPLMLMCIFLVLRSFIGINSGNVPYPVLTLAALSIWIFFQESASEGVNSVVGNASLIRKIYFPREVFPLTSVSTKLVELGINFAILAGFMAWYGILPGIYALWVPLLVLYTVLALAHHRLRRLGPERLLPRRLDRIARAALAHDVPLPGHLPAPAGQEQAPDRAGSGGVVRASCTSSTR